MISFLYVIPALCALIAGVIAYTGLSAAQSAPQQAAEAAIALVWAIIPYCGVRAVHEAVRAYRESREQPMPDLPVLKAAPSTVGVPDSFA